MELERLQKVMANAGVDSRRNCEEIIKAKRVKVNGVLVTELGVKVSKKDVITVDDKILKIENNKVYYVFNKPEGYSLRKGDKRNVYSLFNVSNLNAISSLKANECGLIILTNDGELKNKFQKTNNLIKFSYEVRIVGQITQRLINLFKKGIVYNENTYKLDDLKLIDYDSKNNSSYFSFSILAKKQDNVAEILKSIKIEVKKLKRTSLDIINLTSLVEGSYRELKIHEIKKLYSL